MKKFIAALKKALAQFKVRSKNEKILIVLAALAITSLLISSSLPKKPEQSITQYIPKSADYLFDLDVEKLKTVKKFIVVESNAEAFRVKRDVFLKFEGAKNKEIVYYYKGVSQDSFNAYYVSTLEKYLKENKNFSVRYMSEMTGINKRLEVTEDPISIIVDKSLIGFMNGFMELFLRLSILIIFLFALFYYQRQSTTTKVTSVKPNEIKDSFDDLIGMEDIKEEILQLEHMYNNKELYRKYNINSNFNVMMTGPAGVGKTKIARCLSKHLNIPLYYGSAASLQSGYVGGGSRSLKELVKAACKNKRAIIFLDEAESLLQNRFQGAQHWEKETSNTLLSLLDGVKQNKTEIIWLVASNMDEYKVDMDEAMLRRFHLKINFRLPSYETRVDIIAALLSRIDSENIEDDINLNHIASISSGMSPATIETVVGRASLIAIQERVKVSQDILLRAFERVAVGLTDRETTRNRNDERLMIARHEAGHFILKMDTALNKCNGDASLLEQHLDVIKISTESVSKMGALGFVLSKEKEAKLLSRADYESEIEHLYGGMANEEIYYGAAGVTAGAQNDIEKVSQMLKVMVGQVGFYQEQKLNYTVLGSKQDLTQKQLEIIEQQSTQLYNDAKKTLIAYKGLTDILVWHLMEQYVLTIDEALVFVREYLDQNQHGLLLKM